MAEIVPAHGIDVGLCNLVGELRVVSIEEGIEAFISEEVLLLYYLGVNIGRAKSFDL